MLVMNKKAFTLMELLVVIAIIGVLAMFLAPAIRNAGENARRAHCANNLRQIGIAMSMYIDEHNFRFTGWRVNVGVGAGRKWYSDLEPYLDDLEVFRCMAYKYHRYG